MTGIGVVFMLIMCGVCSFLTYLFCRQSMRFALIQAHQKTTFRLVQDISSGRLELKGHYNYDIDEGFKLADEIMNG
jgi:hypothetical protein